MANRFSSREEMVKFFFGLDKIQAEKYMEELLLKRKAEKNLIYVPCNVELRSINDAPSIISFLGKSCKDYYNWASEILHLPAKFEDKYRFPFYGLSNQLMIQIDTREQAPLHFNNVIKTDVKKLDFGDYKLYNENNYEVYFERKSGIDFVGTLGVGIERFEREIQRAKDSGKYLIIIVEENLHNLLNFKKLGGQYLYTKVTPQFVFKNVRELLQKFDNIQFLFVDGRNIMQNTMKRIFNSGGAYKKCDLQFLYDFKAIYSINI